MDVKNDVRQGLLSKEDTNSKLVNSPADLAGGIWPRSSGGGGGVRKVNLSSMGS